MLIKNTARRPVDLTRLAGVRGKPRKGQGNIDP